jgi:hypothetical protein
MPDVTVTLQTFRNPIIQLPKVELFAKKSRTEPNPLSPVAITNDTGKATFQLEPGVWILSTKVPSFPGNPPRRFQNPDHLVVVPKGLSALVVKPNIRVIDAGEDCASLTRRLKKRLKAGQYQQARALVQKLEYSYNNYREIPELVYFTALEALLQKAEKGEDISEAVENIVFEQRFWG